MEALPKTKNAGSVVVLQTEKRPSIAWHVKYFNSKENYIAKPTLQNS